MRIRNKVTAFAVMAVFMLSAAACGKKEDAPVETAAPAEEAPSIDVPEETAADNVSVEETTEEETLETVFFDNLTKETHFGLITETGFCNYEIAAGSDWYKYKLKIDNLEKGMVPWYLGDGDVACRMYYTLNDDDKFMMTFGLILDQTEGTKDAAKGCFHPYVFRNASVGELFERGWMPYHADSIGNISIIEFVEDELLRIVKNGNMGFENPPNDKFGAYAEKNAGNGKSDYYLYYRDNSDSSKSSEFVVKGFESNRWVGFEPDGKGYRAELLSKDDMSSIPLGITFEMDAGIEFLRSLNVKNSSEKLGGDVVDGSFSNSESDDDYSVYYAMIKDNVLTYCRYFYNKKNNTSSEAYIRLSNNGTDNAEECFEILRNIELVEP